jgi:hypothetical protein
MPTQEATTSTPWWTNLTEEQQKIEALKCAESCAYFIDTYCMVYDAISEDWIPFKIWPAQFKALRVILNNLLVVILKARQIGMTWLVLGYALWKIIFRPKATVLLFSKRDNEAIDLLDFRLKGMYKRLPPFLQARAVIKDSKHEWELSNGSRAMAFPTTGGDSYTATLVIGDEFDLVPNQKEMINAVKPTIDNGGQMILLSRPDKDKPASIFKQIYRAAKQMLNAWAPIFLSWRAHPERNDEWYEAQRQDIESRDGDLDDLHEQYPANDVEALEPRSKNKRIVPGWLNQCYVEMKQIPAESLPAGAPAIPGLRIYRLPEAGREYRIGSDTAEGNPTSDDSTFTVLDRLTGEEVASLAGKLQPSTLGSHIDTVGRYFNRAPVLVERNNHGHAVILWLKDHSELAVLDGYDNKSGWNDNSLGKTMLYTTAADEFRHKNTVIHTFMTLTQLMSIEGSTLRAPEGEADDLADSYALALAARTLKAPKLEMSANPFYG